MIVVTGASRGLGRAISKRLIKNGIEVIGLARSVEGLDFDAIACDVGDYQSLKAAAKDIKKRKQPLRGVINAAGIASMNLTVTTDAETVEKVIRTNLMGTIFSCQVFSPLLMRQKTGRIINFSTIAVPLSLKGEAVYAASKSGVEAFSKSFAREMADFGITVNCIAPGPIKTELLRGISDDQIKSITDRQIIPRVFDKEDICDVVELVLDDKSSSLSGQILNVGGV